MSQWTYVFQGEALQLERDHELLAPLKTWSTGFAGRSNGMAAILRAAMESRWISEARRVEVAHVDINKGLRSVVVARVALGGDDEEEKP